ncbi:EamA family transporter [Lysobacter sp. GCM10012299]|jgi:multidrug transporter EmrE-like cation transporter|uniref:EamA family transporter n=1 Tax=Lysobacter sp. GCM10012299 TaxID=3317333 RepID=UPI00360D60F3
MAYFFIALMLVLTCYGQLVIKWRVNLAGPLPADLPGQAGFMFHLLTSPWIISGLLAAFLASVCWMAALTKLDLSRAYPFTALSFILILVFSAVFFNDAITTGKLIGTALIIGGVCVIAMAS